MWRLPDKLNTKDAAVLVLAIGIQESALRNRTQRNGPARGYHQFEQGGGIQGVLTHQASSPLARQLLIDLDYPTLTTIPEAYEAVAHNDILDAGFARLLIYTLPQPLPDRADEKESWAQYLLTWRPGLQRPALWHQAHATALATVNAVATQPPFSITWLK